MWARRFRPAGPVAPIAAAAVLGALAVAYLFTVEPAPTVIVGWRPEVTAGERAALERRFRLVRPLNPENRYVTYELLDTSSRNIRDLLGSADVENTGGFDVLRYQVRPDAEYGSGWTWIGNRLPVLRQPGVVPALVIGCVVVIGRWAWRSVRPGSS